MTIFMIGILYLGSGRNREEFVHTRPSGIRHDVGQVDDVALPGGRAVLVLREVDDVLARFAGHSSNESRVIATAAAAVVGDLGPAHALLAVLDRHWPCRSPSVA
jgi:hypothetical protein